MKKPVNYVPPKEIWIGPDLLILVDNPDFVWDRATDNPQLDLRKKDWDNFNPKECLRVELSALTSWLEKSA